MDHRPSKKFSSDTDERKRRPVRSYVLRKGRVTEGQRRALEELWPVYGLEPEGGLIDFADAFGDNRPVVLEIGFGNGDATWQMAAAEPEKNFLGVEVHRPGVGHLLLKIEEHRLQNVRIACEDAVEMLKNRVRDRSLDGVRIYFPDPWHKKRHHKRRMIQRPFIELLARKFRTGGVLHMATDWAPYAEHMLEVMQASPEFENLSPGGLSGRPEWRPQTKYEKRGERLGHRVCDLVFRRNRQE